VLVRLINPGPIISKSSLEELGKNKLGKDDVFRTAFYDTVVFYGATKDEVHIGPDALETLAAWETNRWYFHKGETHSPTRTGPYVSLSGRFWQPWRVYLDFNGIFMCTFKPGSGPAGR
jgi:hypothetical protein